MFPFADHRPPRRGLATTRALLALACLLPLTLALACGGGGGGPTAPAMPTVGGTASLSGQVTVTGQTGGSSISSGAAAPNAPGITGIRPGARDQRVSSLGAADSSGAGVTVQIAGTSLSTTASPDGSFRLSGVPEGNINVLFQTGSSTATVGIDSVQPNETIRLDVTVSGSSASVDALERDGDEGMDDGGSDGGGGGGGSGGGGTAELDLQLEISPDDWNLNYAHSSGTVTAFIRGTGFQEVLLDSIVLEGDNPDAMPLDPVSATRQGDHVKAAFAKSQVLDLLDDPQPGSMHTVTLTFEVDRQMGQMDALSLDDQVTIEADNTGDGGGDGGDDGSGDQVGNLVLQLSPSSWNTNYATANGSVTAFVRGDGLDQIDTDSLELSGDDEEADPLPATFARLEGDHVRAQFPKNQVLDLLMDPTSGSEHTVTLHLTANDGADSFDLEAEVKIVGKSNG